MRTRVVLLIALLTGLLVILLGGVVTRLLEHHLVKQKRVQGRTALLAMQAALDLRQEWGRTGRDTAQDMSHFVRLMAQNLELSSLVIVDEGQNIIAHSQADMIGLVFAEADLSRAMTERKLIHRLIGRDTETPEVVFSGPLYRSGKAIGAVRFILPINDLYVALTGMKRILWLYALMDALAVILFGSFMLWRLLVRPVEQMVQMTEKMAAGEYRVPAPPATKDEIGRLGRALAKLAATLADREKINKRQVKRLETINRELQEAHRQLLHTDRLAYVGRVAAGVAHEVGNPLGAIYGYLDILRDADLQPTERQVVERIEKDVKRIDSIVRELLDFSRVKEAQIENADVVELAREAVQLMKSQRGLDHVEVQVETEAEVPPVRLDRQQFVQVVLNILLNATDAMDGVGRIRIRAEGALFERSRLLDPQLPGVPPEDEVPYTDHVQRGIVFSDAIGPGSESLAVFLHVTDSGPGMEPTVLGQMFDPFFTTKKAGRGTGLGMAICHRIIGAMSGLIRVESRPGQGSRVSLILPANEGEFDDE
ncbi:MAG: ATP-binding protein [Candidatus Lernaella stagnicola]|nr:ATP-binding protein [Candidatus Lernaella stagnicola]